MRRSSLLPLLLGMVVTLAVVGVDLAGGLTAWEWDSIDLRVAAAPRPRTPMTEDIIHVDIDGKSEDLVGRWPWSRSKLARAVDELARAGARTIALDLLLTEREGDADDDAGDAALAAALARVPCVLAVSVRDRAVYDAVWRDGTGPDELDRLLDVLGADIQLDEDAVARRAGLSGERLARYKIRPTEFKQAAAWRVLERHGDEIADFAAFEGRVAPRLSGLVSSYPEQLMLRAAWDQRESWRRLRPRLLPGEGRGSFRDSAPRPVFAAAASGVGFVDVVEQIHADGAVREVDVVLDARGGRTLHFGLAAAALFRGLDPRRLEATADRLVFGDVVLPLRDGRLWITWPTSETRPRWKGLLRRDADDPPSKGHLSLGQVYALGVARATQAENLEKLRHTSALILAFADVGCPSGDELEPAMQDAVRDEVDFALEDAEGMTAAEVAAESEAYRDHLHNCRLWREVRYALDDGTARIERGERELSDIDGKLVFVGWTDTGALADFVPTSIDPKTPGVVVHAAIANMALDDRAVRFPPSWQRPLIVIGFGLVTALAASSLPTLPSALVAALALAAYLGASTWLFFRHEVLMPLAAPVTAGLCAWVAVTALQASLSQRARHRITRQFKARVSPQLVDHLVAHPDALTMSGEEREMSVLFADLAGFTAISESLGGPATVATLNLYLGELTRRLVAHGAYVNKFLGDGVMAFWSAFERDPDQARKACAAAIECRRAVAQLNDDRRTDGVPPLGLRIGIATDRVVVGDCGAPPALNDYTVIGDAVNLASRLESANKQFGSGILVNGRTRELLGAAPLRLRPVGRLVVVGQTAPADVYELLPPDVPEELVDLSGELVAAFGDGRFADVVRALDALETRFGPSRLVDVYREALDRIDDEFDGTLRLRVK